MVEFLPGTVASSADDSSPGTKWHRYIGSGHHVGVMYGGLYGGQELSLLTLGSEIRRGSSQPGTSHEVGEIIPNGYETTNSTHLSCDASFPNYHQGLQSVGAIGDSVAELLRSHGCGIDFGANYDPPSLHHFSSTHHTECHASPQHGFLAPNSRRPLPGKPQLMYHRP
jgi:hypothetical protein